MAKRILTNISRVGGYSFDKKQGIKHSFGFGQSVEFRDKPSQLYIKPKTVKESGSTVVTEITDGERAPGGDIYFAGVTEIYKRVPESAGGLGTWSVFSTDAAITNVKSLAYMNNDDAILVPDVTTVHRISDMSGTPTFNADYYAELLDLSATGGAATYTLTTAVNEGATHKLAYTPTLEPLLQVKLYVVAKGTGDWTLTMHDDADNSLGTVTITNANLTNGALNTFEFDPPVRMDVVPNAQDYHFHVHSTVADGTVQTTTASDLSDADYEIYADRLVECDYHPIMQYQHYYVIGNESYLTLFEPLEPSPTKVSWESHRLTFPRNVQVNGLAEYDEFLAISGLVKKSSDYGDSTFGQDATSGVIYFWDGYSTSYNFLITIPEGAPESMFSYKNVIYYIANGYLYAWAGGQPVLVRAMPGVSDFTSSEGHDADVYLQAGYNSLDVSDGLLLAGFPYKTVNESIKHGVYSWGSGDKNYSDSFGYDHVPSHGRTETVFADSGTPPLPISGITMVKAFGSNLLVAWRDSADSGSTTNYGVDVIKDTNDPYATATVENLIFDHKQPWKDKEAVEYHINFESLPTGCTVTPKYKINRASSWTTGTTATAGSTSCSLHINKRFKEIETGYDLVGSSSGTPVIIGDTLKFDDLAREAI